MDEVDVSRFASDVAATGFEMVRSIRFVMLFLFRLIGLILILIQQLMEEVFQNQIILIHV